MQIFKEKEENPKKKFRHLKADLKNFGKVLRKLEMSIKKFSLIPPAFENIKEEALTLFFECLAQNLILNGFFFF